MEINYFSNRALFKTLSLVAAIFVLMTSAFLFYQHFNHPKQKFLTNNVPNSIVSGMALTQMSKTGQLDYQFFSPLVYHFTPQNRSNATHPVAYFYKPGQPRWKLTANAAYALDNNKIVHLIDNVRAHQNAGKKNKSLTLTTDRMTLYPQQKVAFNKVFVKAIEPGLTITAVGFHADMNKGEIKLLSKTKANYSGDNN
jgi:lipopolysaccharide export system protein LptC